MLSNSPTFPPTETHHDMWPALTNPSKDDAVHRCVVNRRLYQISSAHSCGQRSSASSLIHRMYATRGYLSAALPDEPPPTRMTLVAREHDATVATLSIGFDSPTGLHVDALFLPEVDVLRQAGRRVCEFTTLAMDQLVRSRRVLASLFHMAYIHAHRVQGFDTLLIEVNPRHVLYYRRMLGFEVMAAQRHSARVEAPAVLLGVNFSYIREQIERFGGRLDGAPGERSMYPDFFSPSEEASIVHRLMPADHAAAPRCAPPRLLQA